MRSNPLKKIALNKEAAEKLFLEVFDE